MSEGLGEHVSYVQTPWEAVRGQSEDIFLMYDWFERVGYDADIEDVRRVYPELLDFRAWVQRGGALPLRERRAA